MSKLTKSLSDLDAMADELLAKSQTAEELDNSEEKVEPETAEELEKSEASEKDEDLKPEEISENTPEDKVENADDEGEESEEDEEPAKEDEVEEDVKKSLEADTEPEVEEKDDAVDEKEELEKSIHSTFESNEEIKKSIDASEFLSAVTEVISKSLADVVYNLQGTSQQSIDSNDVLAKSLQASLNLNKSMIEELNMVKSQNDELRKSIAEGFDEIREQMEELSHQPASMRKSVGSVSVHERNFQKSLTGANGVEHLSKSEVLAKLSNLMYSGSPLVQPSDIISYESGAPLRPEVAQLINQ